jgi:hypothetical protein
MQMKEILIRGSLMLALLSAAGHVHALCNTFPPDLHVLVGDTAGDSACQYNDIQSAIDAASTNPQCTMTIHVTREHLWTQQHLNIADRNITIAGWNDGVTCADIRSICDFISCPLPSPAANPLVTLAGSEGHSVLHIEGHSNVSLLNLELSGGSVGSDQSGGGIYYNGDGSLTLTSTSVSNNHAGYGGGIEMYSPDGASLNLKEHSLVLVNTADVSGGGVRIEGNTRLYALDPSTMIGYNHAPNGYGGGVEVLGPARADFGSSGYGGLGVVHGNDAQYGGGIDILTFQGNANAIVRLFTTDAHNPVKISDNFASHAGGAVYLKPLFGVIDTASAVLCAYDFRIEDNVAIEGTAIYADADYSLGSARGGSIALNTNPLLSFGNECVRSEAPPALGAVACAPGVACNQFVGNKAQDQNGQPTAGSMILLQSAAALYGDRFSARGNTGAHLLREVGDISDYDSYALLTNCLFTGNTLTQELATQTDGGAASLSLESCTIADNQIGAPYTFLAPAWLALSRTIIDQPGRSTVDPPITDPAYVAYVLTNDRSTLPDIAYVDEGEPSFVDAAHGDYHLFPTSLGVDSAPIDANTNAPHADLDRRTRVVDLPFVANNFGPMDLGAYEIQLPCAANDTVFCDGFELLGPEPRVAQTLAARPQ